MSYWKEAIVKGLLSLYIQGLEADDDTGNFQIMQKRISPQLVDFAPSMLFFLGKCWKEKKFAIIILRKEEIG